MKYEAISTELFQQNRQRFTQQMKPNSMAIFHSNDQMPRCGDQTFPFRQNSHLFYLCGIDQEETILVLFPDCARKDHQEVLFVKKTNEHIAVWEGHKYTKEEAQAASGIKKVIWIEEMSAIFNELILLAENIYVNTNENDRFNSEVPSRDLRAAQQMMARYPVHQYHRSQPIIKKLVMVKSQLEVNLISRACDITEKAFRRVLDFTRPGVTEYEVEAEIIHEFIRNRATGHAYSPIIASGKNACILHYNDNNLPCQDGDILLMDFGAEYGNYAADLTRSIPVNGRFTARQRAVYNAVLRVMRAATQLLVPGATLEVYHKEVGKIMESELLGLGLISREDIKNQDPEVPAYKKYFMHGTSHHLGLDVHDLCHRYEPLQAGMVFTVEPGIYIPAENLGIRLENDVWLTDHAPIDLMKNIPIEADEIETLMNAK